MNITPEICNTILKVVDAGLSSGVGDPIPGSMCVEAAVCYAMGLPHSDRPTCVDEAVRCAKITLNDCEWSSKAARAKGLRELSIAQLGSAGVIDPRAFAAKYVELVISTALPMGLRAAGMEQETQWCESEGTESAVSRALESINKRPTNIFSYASLGAACDLLKTAAFNTSKSEVDATNAADAHRKIVQAADFVSDAVSHISDAAGILAGVKEKLNHAGTAADSSLAHRTAVDKARDSIFKAGADCLLLALVHVNSPGCEFLHLCGYPE